MANQYNYIDPDYVYTESKTGVLRNLANVTDADTLIAEYRTIDKKDKPQLSQKLAEILDNVNYLHPFRDGNGRTQREFLRLLALEKGLFLNLNPPDNVDIYERYMSGTINGDVDKLAKLILEITSYY